MPKKDVTAKKVMRLMKNVNQAEETTWRVLLNRQKKNYGMTQQERVEKGPVEINIMKRAHSKSRIHHHKDNKRGVTYQTGRGTHASITLKRW